MIKMRITTPISEPVCHQIIVKHFCWKKNWVQISLRWFKVLQTLHKRWRFSLNVSPTNLTKFAVTYRFGYIAEEILNGKHDALDQHPCLDQYFFMYLGWVHENNRSFRSSHKRYCTIKVALKNFAKFTGELLCQSLFFNNVTGLRSLS